MTHSFRLAGSTAALVMAGLFAAAAPAAAQSAPAAGSGPTYGPELQGFDYAYPVRDFVFRSQGKPMKMAYLDVTPAQPNGRTVVLLHGKNFCAGTWEQTIAALSSAGYRVVAPDQIGFCKSSKPDGYQYTFQQLADNTHRLLAHLGVTNASVMGHSMGGMLATRYALLYPESTDRLLMVNPIGLEDWKALGVPYQTVDQWYASERKTSFAGIKKYQQATYYAGHWEPAYDKWVTMQAGMFNGDGGDRVAWHSALTYDMVYTQPVVYEFDRLRVPTTLFIGLKDNTAVGKGTAPPEVQPTLGRYTELGKRTRDRIPNAQLVEFEDLGHSPQIQAPERFHRALLDALAS